MCVNAEHLASKPSRTKAQGSCTQAFATRYSGVLRQRHKTETMKCLERTLTDNLMIPLYIDLLNRSTVDGQFTGLTAKTINVANKTYLRIIT
jgi:hypothetical protein